MDTPYTIASVPPGPIQTQRRSRWAELLEEARQRPEEWRRLVEPMSKSTSSQIASDLRNAHHRPLETNRVKGLKENERWEAQWGADPDAPDSDRYFVWLRYMGPIEKPKAPRKRPSKPGRG